MSQDMLFWALNNDTDISKLTSAWHDSFKYSTNTPTNAYAI